MDHTTQPAEYSIGKILSLGWKYFEQNWKTILFIILIIYIPINIIVTLTSIHTNYADFGSVSGGMRLYQLLQAVIGIIATMAIALVVKSNIDGNTLSLKESLKKAARLWPKAFSTNILLAICLIGLTLLLIVPGLIFGIYWMFSLYAVIFHDKIGTKAFGYSKSVVKGRWWKVLGYSIVFGILMVIASLVIGLITGLISGLIPTIAGSSIVEIVLTTGGDFVLAFFTVVSTVFFLNFDKTKRVEAIEEKPVL